MFGRATITLGIGPHSSYFNFGAFEVDAGQRRTGMRPASAAVMEVPRSRTAIGDRSFSIAGPRVCNTLPASVRYTNSSLHLRKLLKAFLCLTATTPVALNWRP